MQHRSEGGLTVTGILLLVAIYSLIFIHFTFPLIKNFDDSIIVGHPDAHVFAWNVHTFTEYSLVGKNPFFTDKVLHPTGTGLIMHTYVPASGLLNLLVRNVALSLNLIIFVNFILSALGAFFLARRYIPGFLLPFIAGFAFAFCPYKMTHLLGQYNLILTGPIPFFILSLTRFIPFDTTNKATFRWNQFLIPALLLFAEFLFDYYLTYYLIIAALSYFAFVQFRLWRAPEKKLAITAGIAIAATFLLVGILEIAGVERGSLYTSADLASYFIPSAFSRFFGTEYVNHLRSDIIKAGPFENITEIGLSLIVLFVLYLFSRQNRLKDPSKYLLLYFIAVFFLFATPVLNIAGHPVFLFPTALLHYVPFLNNFRVSARFVIMIMLFLPILSLLFLHDSFTRKSVRSILAAAVFLSLYVQYIPKQYSLQKTKSLPAVYKRLGTVNNGTILEIPFGIWAGKDIFTGDNTYTSTQMQYQINHNQNILGGYISRLPHSVLDIYEADPFASRLLSLQTVSRRDLPLPDSTEVIRFINTFNINFVIVYPGYETRAAGEYAIKTLRPFSLEEELIDGFTYLKLRKVSAAANPVVRSEKKNLSSGKEIRKELTGKGRKRLHKGPMHELDSARNSISHALRAQADIYACTLYLQAVSYLESAQREVAIQHRTFPLLRDFSAAKEMLDSAIIHSERSSKTARELAPRH